MFTSERGKLLAFFVEALSVCRCRALRACISGEQTVRFRVLDLASSGPAIDIDLEAYELGIWIRTQWT